MATGNKKSNFSINIESKAAEASIKRLQAEVDKLTASLKKSGISNSEYVKTQNKLITAEKLLNKEIKEHTKVLNQDTVSHKNSINAIQQRIKALRQEMNAMDMSSDKFKQKSADMRQLTASMLEGSSATGLHAASAMELGRVFSDAPYGIRGVANNISQLGSLMAQAATTTDAATGKAIGMTGAMKGLWKSLMGPLGILLAFQAVVAAIEYFSGKASEASNLLGDFSREGVTTTTTKLHLLVKATNDSTVALDQKQEMVRRANEEIKGLNAELDENGNLTIESARNIAAMSEELMKMAQASFVVEQIKELNKELAAITMAGDIDTSGGQGFLIGALGFLDPKLGIKAAAKEVDKQTSEIKEKIKELYELAKEKKILPQVFGEDDKRGGGRSSAIKIFKSKMLDLEKYMLGLDKERELIQEKNVRERLKLEQKYAKDELDLRLKTFIERERQRRDDFIKKAKTQKEIDQANKTFNDMMFQAEGEHSMAMRTLVAKNTAETKELERKIKEEYDIASQKAALDRASAELDLMNDLLDEKDPRALAVLQQKQRDVWALEDAAFEEDMARKLIKLEREGIGLKEREFLIDQERMARIADRNNAEVDMEVAKIESIKAVRLEYIGWLSSIGSTMKKLSKDNEGLAKAAVIVEKSAATAKVIASTQAANAEIMQESGAAASKSIVQGKAAIATGAILAANPATAAIGAAQMSAGKASITAAAPIAASAKGRILKNNIGAGLAIANIWAESQGSSGDTGGASGGGGGNTFAPNFNVVGNSETNQLAESIGGQVNQPNRAYVVYEDIQNATELNANAVESSGI